MDDVEVGDVVGEATSPCRPNDKGLVASSTTNETDNNAKKRAMRTFTLKQMLIATASVAVFCFAILLSEPISNFVMGIRIERDSRPVLQIDANEPFVISLGRGSGMCGLDTIRIDETGNVVAHRYTSWDRKPQNSVEATTLQLTNDQLAKVLRIVKQNRLANLHRAYHAKGVYDGTQWILYLKQGENEKSVYFNNVFPMRVSGFAKQLDSILNSAGLNNATWTPVKVQPAQYPRHEHEGELWESLHR